MNKKIKQIIALVVLLILLTGFFIFYAKNFSPLFKGEEIVNDSQEEKTLQGKIAYMKIQLRDAEMELLNLRELAQDQMTLAKIDQLFMKIDYFRSEIDKPFREVDEAIVDEFYNSGFWESIIELKE